MTDQSEQIQPKNYESTETGHPQIERQKISSRAGNLLVQKDKQTDNLEISLNDTDVSFLLPDGYQFMASESSKCMHADNRVEIALDEIQEPGFVLTVLHELGHAVKDVPVNIMRADQIGREIKDIPKSAQGDKEYIKIQQEHTRLIEERERERRLVKFTGICEKNSRSMWIRYTEKFCEF